MSKWQGNIHIFLFRPNVAEIKVPAESGDDVDSGHSSEESSDEERDEVAAEDDRTEDPETNDESFTSGYVDEPGQLRPNTADKTEREQSSGRTPSPQLEQAAVPHRTDDRTEPATITSHTEVATEKIDDDSKASAANPFGEEEEEEDDLKREQKEGEEETGKEHKHTKSTELSAFCPDLGDLADQSKIEICVANANESLNPFGSDADSEDEKPTGQSATLTTAVQLQQPSQQNSKSHATSLNPFGSDISSDDDRSRGSVSPSPSTRSSTTRLRKKRRAPPPPPGSKPGTPKSIVTVAGSLSRPVPAPRPSLAPPSAAQSRYSAPPPSTASAEAAKRLKDENNMNRRSQIMESIRGGGGEHTHVVGRPDLPPSAMMRSDTSLSSQTQADSVVSSSSQSETVSLMSVSTTTTQSSADHANSAFTSELFSPLAADKADEGQWRKKKGPAPPRPIPPRRTVKKLHRKVINQELEDIEVKQNELERQGVCLEKTIREICDKSDAEEGADRDSLGPEAEDLIIQLFDLVNEKNELFRRQTELIYMKKENRLEEQHADLEYQIRVLMAKPENLRTEEDRIREEKLIGRLVQVVGLRNEIVDCLEMDRLR